MRMLMAGLFVAMLVIVVGRAQTTGPIVRGAHRFERVVEGIYYATASGTMTTGANSPVLVNDDEVLVVDSSITPAAARAMVEDIKAITPKPVRYVVIRTTTTITRSGIRSSDQRSR